MAKLYLVAAQPCFAIPIADKDDGLFLKLARHLLDGQWLGPYDTTTLAKGAGYPLFIALTALTGLPLHLAQHLLYLLAVCLLVRAVRPLLPGPAWAFALFTLLWWNPMSYEMSVLGRVLRQNIYTPLAMMVIAGAVARHWPAEVTVFTAQRGTPTRQLLFQDPNPPAQGAVPARQGTGRTLSLALNHGLF